MRKLVFIEEEVLVRLMEGKRVEGSLYRDKFTGIITFNAYKRKSRNGANDRLVKKLPWGWVKESVQRIKVYGSFPKDLGAAAVMGLMDDHHRDAKNAMIERELIEFC